MIHNTVVKRPNIVIVFFPFLLDWDIIEIRYAATKPIGIGINVLNDRVRMDSINKPISFINK